MIVPAARSLRPTWDEVAEHVIKERSFSRMMLKLNTAEKETVDEVYAETGIELADFLERALVGFNPLRCQVLPSEPFCLIQDSSVELTLTGARGENKSTVKLAAKFIPIHMNLEPRESVNNTGVLTLDILSAKGLKSADRNGYSDPYATVEMGDERIFKTEVKKKTLNPNCQSSQCSHSFFRC